MKKFIIPFILLLVSAAACRPKETLTREEVIAAIHQFDTGWKNKNGRTVDSVLSPSYLYYTQSGGIFSRANVVQTAGSADYRLETMNRETFDIKIVGNTAVVNTVWKAKGAYFDDPFDDTQRCSITVIKTNGKVEILSEHCTPIR